MSSRDRSPTVSPRSANLTAMFQRMLDNHSQSLQRQMEDLRLHVEQRHDNYESDYESDHDRRRRRNGNHRGGNHRERRRPQGGRTHEETRRTRDDDYDHHSERLDGVKIQVPPFMGLNNPEAYLEWELKMEQVFDCHDYSETKKVKVAALEFQEYAMVWWDNYQKDRRRCGGEPIDSWDEMKTVMRRRFIPSSYQRDLHNKLQRLTQGSRTVDEYFKEMEISLLRSNLQEDREATMARFLHGLNPEIQDVVELQPYVELEDLVQKAIKVEQQLKRKKSRFSSSSNYKSPSNGWKNKSEKEGTPSKEGTPGTKDIVGTKNGGKPSNEGNSRSRDIKCFKCLGHGHIASQCPTKRTMTMRNGVVESQSESSSSEKEESSEEEVFMPDSDILMIRRLLGSQIKEHEDNQRENLFHSRCLIGGNVCLLIIDGGSCTNVVSTRLVHKLGLVTKAHPAPYRLQWLKEVGEIIVNRQAEVRFSIGKYEDSVLCDVVTMEASHLLLGRPWQFDRKAIHDGFSNKYSFTHLDHKVVLSPLSPRQASEDQQRLKEKIKQERKAEKELATRGHEITTKPTNFSLDVLQVPEEQADSRSNPIEEGGDDVNQLGPRHQHKPDPDSRGPITRSKAKRTREPDREPSLGPKHKGPKPSDKLAQKGQPPGPSRSTHKGKGPQPSLQFVDSILGLQPNWAESDPRPNQDVIIRREPP